MTLAPPKASHCNVELEVLFEDSQVHQVFHTAVLFNYQFVRFVISLRNSCEIYMIFTPRKAYIRL